MRLISGTLRSTPLLWFPVLSNFEPPAIRRKAATDKLVEKIVKHDSWPIQPDILNPPLLWWHPGSRSGWTCNQLTSKVDGGITRSRLRCSTLNECATPQSCNQVLTSLGNSSLWTVFARNRDTAMPAELNVFVARPRRCPTLSNHVLCQNWVAVFLGYTLRMKTTNCLTCIILHFVIFDATISSNYFIL